VRNEEEETAEETNKYKLQSILFGKQYYKTTPTYWQENYVNYIPSNTITLKIEKLYKWGGGGGEGGKKKKRR